MPTQQKQFPPSSVIVVSKIQMADAMAASSGGIQWSAIIKLFSGSHNDASDKLELLDLCLAIVKSESDILRYKGRGFYNWFAVLAADYITNNARNLSSSQLEVVHSACQVLLKYLIGALQTNNTESNYNNVLVEKYLKAIRILCLGQDFFSPTEISTLVISMKGETLPTNTAPAGEKDASNKQETSKPRTDLSITIFEQLTMPLREGTSNGSEQSSSGQSTGGDQINTNDPITEITKLLLKANSETLQSLRAGDTLADLCLNLPSIKKAKVKIDETLAGKPFSLPTTHTEATSIRNSLSATLADINLASSAINLPVLEPLTPSKLDKLCNLGMAVLYCALNQSCASSVLAMCSAVSPKCPSGQSQSLFKDDEDSGTITLVEEALNMFAYIGTTIKNSTRAGGHVYQNHLLSGAWVLIAGLQSHVSSTTTEKLSHLRDDKGRSPSKSLRETGTSGRYSYMKFQQAFSVLSVALAGRALSLLSKLFEDLNLEVCGTSGNVVQVDPAPISIMGQFSALQRIARLLGAAPLNQLLFYIALISYRKACTLKRVHPPEGDIFSQSDSTTYYEDMIMCSDENSTDEDDDSEPILGLWFEETLAPPENPEPKTTNVINTGQVKPNQERLHTIVPETGEASGFITLATNIFVFMNRHFLRSKSSYVTRYVKTGLGEHQISILALIIRDLDRETSRTEIGTIPSYFGVALGQLYCEFSGALTRFTHNLVTHSGLQGLQVSLLNHLGVSPWNTDVPHAWPLQVYPRTLAVLSQVLLLRPQNEKEASVISIWHRLVNTLIESVMNPPTVVDNDNEDLNVEHAQVLLYLFHLLNLMQKKSVLLLLASAILRCSEVAQNILRDTQLLHISRLLLLFDYIMKHLYDAPATLLEQIQWNLFYATNLNTDKDKENNMSRMYTHWKEIEENHRKFALSEEFSMKPRFYVVTSLEVRNQDPPKLDGLACNFILGTPDKIRYPLLLDGLIEILNVTHVTSGAPAVKMSFLGMCATQYCYTICWRLLQILPPSTPYIERLSLGEPIVAGPLLLHSLIWGPRTNHKVFSRWLKDCLVKQGIYTQHTDKLLKTCHDTVTTLKYDVTMAKNCIITLIPDTKKGSLTKDALPPLWHLFILDAVLAKVQVALSDESESSEMTAANRACVQELIPHVLRLTQSILYITKWSLLNNMVEQTDPPGKYTLQDYESIQEILAIASTKNTLTSTLTSDFNTLLPSSVVKVLQSWNAVTLEDCTSTPFINDTIPAESYILKIIDTHISTLSLSNPFSINLSLKRLLQCLVKFLCQHAPKIENTDTKNKAIELLVLVTMDIRTEFLYDTVSKTLDKMIGDLETDEHQKRVYLYVLENTYKLITNFTNNYNDLINEKLLHNYLKFYEKIIEKSSGRQALELFFTGDKDLVKVLMSVSSPQMSQQYSTRVLHFFNKLYQAAEKSSTDPSLNYLCGSMSKLADVKPDTLQTWLRHLIIGTNSMTVSESSSNIQTPTATAAPTNKNETATENGKSTENNTSFVIRTDSNASPCPSEDQKSLIQENSQLLQALTNFIVKQTGLSEDVPITILNALIPLGSIILSPTIEGAGFTDLMVVMTTLADAGIGKGHATLVAVTSDWLELCCESLTQKEVVDNLGADVGTEKNSVMLEAACCLLEYLSDIVNALSSNQGAPSFRAVSPPWEGETPLEHDVDWPEEGNDDEDSGDDSDEDSLCNKLCTFTITQKEFMNQHWYHCHTCRMLDGVGVCSVCARVCHKGHDLSYAKFGNFFCDCGAKEDGSCQALVKRSPQSNEGPSTSNNAATTGFASEHMLTSSLRRRASSPVPIDKMVLKKERKTPPVVKQIEGSREFLMTTFGSSNMPKTLLNLVQSFTPSVEAFCNRNSAVGCHARALKALQQLHSVEKKYVYNEQLMVPTLGSQEGAFENVRMSYAGEQGQTIRQLLSAHIVRRVAMCCMYSAHGKRQHLAVSHEKGKITVLQLSALLKQADSSMRKLTLTRLASAPIPFTVLSLSSNLCNEDYLAVCGLKDCHILTFNSNGSVSDHLVLHPQLETGNFIIKAIWLPGSQTQLALVTADFVKVYDLAQDDLCPKYYFLVPSGKIRDCTFMYEDKEYNILLMSSPGHIYYEALNEESLATHGAFYVTNTLEVFHLDVTDVNGQVAGGGVSIYYSHTLGLLFYSYAQGKSFVSPITPKNNCLTVIFPITIPFSTVATSKSNGSKNPTPQPLCQWTEIPNHPGLICCAMQSTNTPVVLMMRPDSIAIHEIKVVPSKSKIMDMVAIRHNSVNEQRTTLILMCEDGSLKIYMANMDQTGFWMSPTIQPAIGNSAVKPKKKKVVKTGKTPSSVTFPVDFFEHSQPMNDVEIGGNDLLQVYNVSQLKHRLNTTGLYVVCTKPLGFTVEITNADNNMVMTGVRVLVGSQDPTRAPSFIEVFGRITTISVHRSRWYDVPFSREESLQADKKITITFGPSQDVETVTMIDSIKVYGKTKDMFGWPEENEETVTANNSTPPTTTTNVANETDQTNNTNSLPLTKLERLVTNILEVLDGTFALFPNEENLMNYKSSCIKIATDLLTLPTPICIQLYSKSLLASLHQTKQLYHSYKDLALLQHVLQTLTSMLDTNPAKIETDIDAESYFRLILIVRGIAVSRPQNLVKFADSHTSIQDVVLDDPLKSKPRTSKSGKNQHLLLQLMDVLWLLHSLNPENPSLVPVVVPGLKHTEQVVHALVEIVHAFNSCDTYSNITIAVYLQLLLCEDPLIAFSAKQAICRVLKPKYKRRRVYIPSPPRCTSPSTTKTEVEEDKPRPTPQSLPLPRDPRFDLDTVEAIALLQPAVDAHNANLEALVGSGGPGYPPVLYIPPDTDDETMVELAIALSLQEHGLSAEQGQHGLQVLGNPALQPIQGQPAQEAGHFSDTTASAAGSDDEGSTAATDGSTLRTSPAEQGGSAGSESGGSGVESITGEHNVSGRSSAYGDNVPEVINTVSRSDTSSLATANYQIAEADQMNQEVDHETDPENSSRLHVLRLQLLERLIEYLPKLHDVDGVRIIPFLQVVLQLTTDLDAHSDRDKNCLNSLLTAIIQELEINMVSTVNVRVRTSQRELQLVIMRLLSVLMSRCKTSGSSTTKPAPTDNSTYISQVTATMLHKADIINYCLKLLQSLLEYWKKVSDDTTTTQAGNNLLKEHLPHSPPDMTPFFLRQFVKGHASDIFQTYPQLLTEMALRLPYQVHKHSEVSEPVTSAFDPSWYRYLCEYMMTSQTPFLRRQVRKLLLFICGNKEKYRQLRDVHALNTHMKAVKKCCAKGGYNSSIEMQHSLSLTYDALVELVEHLKMCLEIALNRTGNWQSFCIHHEKMIPFLFQVSCLLDEGVAPTILHLLNCAIVVNASANTNKKNDASAKPSTSSRKEREKSDDSATEALFEESNCIALVEQINKQVSRDILRRFIKTFVLETNSTLVRWQAHSLIVAIYKNSKSPEQSTLLDLLWSLWPCLPAYGRKAAQFVDLLGYFSLKFSESSESPQQISEYVEKAVDVLRVQNQLLAHHPNASLYTHMSQYVELEGYYLESEPCLVCNNPEVPLSTIKLSSVKVDSKFTTTTQIVKLLSSHTISKITVRIADLKRTKMVRTINIYYNNRSVQAVVELKNKPALWHKAKKVSLQSAQTEVKIEFPLPIVACNLMIEYADFYENLQASSETLQCPRCSAAVPANPGVCSNCGENVFQCHKCRAINYDEKDPFLCHACGFCKYAKFDFTLQARPCCAVEPIETDEDRKKMVSNINSLLEKADRVYKQLMANKPNLEALVVKITEQRSDRKLDEPSSSSVNTNSTVNSVQASLVHIKVNKTIQMLAQQYCSECKMSFEELSKIIQRVLVSRKELIAYDRRHKDSEAILETTTTEEPGPSDITTQPLSVISRSSSRCYGCSSAATEHCLTLLRALALNPKTRELLCSKGLIQDLLWNNLRKGSTQLQEDVRQLLCVLSKDNEKATEELCSLIMERITLSLNSYIGTTDLASSICHEMALLASLLNLKDNCWEMRFRLLVELFLRACEDTQSPVVIESIILPCLKIWYNIIKPPDNTTSKKAKEKANVSVSVIRVDTVQVGINVFKWLEKDGNNSYKKWKRYKPEKTEAISVPKEKAQAREFYLIEKYGKRWKEKVSGKAPPISDFNVLSWVKAVLFNPSSRLARQVTSNILEYCCSSFSRKEKVLLLLTQFLEELSGAGESSSEFLTLYQNLIQEVPWKQYLTVHGVLLTLADLITQEIEQLHYLEETTLTSDLTQGYALNQLTELLSSFLDDSAIRRQYKGKLVGAVLNGYLSLRRLVVQRTRLIDDTQEKLLELLEEMTTGTEEETKAFMIVCMETVEKYSLQDILTPVFIFERLCSIIYPEENDIGEFFLTLEKDPQQEDFLQGRMLGNPYSSLEAGLGPLMRDVKNKICQDCELVALLEDDNGMELLVNNKIMSLDLPVRDVYKKVWIAEGGEHESMRVVYRMRGLLGDATEEFVETLNNKSQAAVNNEEVYKMANILAECGGLQIMVKRLGAIQNVVRAKPLLQVLLKLFRVSVKVVRVQEVLTQPELGAMAVFLKTLQLCLDTEGDSTQFAITEQLLDIMETVLSKATSQSLDKFEKFSETFGGPEYVQSILKYTNQPSIKNNQSVQEHLMHVLASLVYGNADRMRVLMEHFTPILNFNKYDIEHTADDQQKLEMFCVLTNGIDRREIGNTLKDYIISMGVINDALEYITMHAPCVKPTLLRTDSDELKEFISKPALKYILRILTGMANCHQNTQMAVATANTIPIIHRLEQVSSDEHVGSLAENLLEALCTNATVATCIEEAREFTRAEKKRLAMAMREKQLGQLGMRTNDKGQVTAKSTILQQMEELGEETGLVCCICREGYKYQPTKVLGIYTFTKRCNVEEFEAKPRKTIGYNTVTHFNIVHIDCHTSAVRLARTRDEWESAALQNANTKCNGLLPLWGPQVPESAFASCLARHNSYLQESTSYRDIGHSSTIHDLKLLLLRFAFEKPFHEDTGGGGPQSNMHMVPYLIHMALYVINTTRVSKKEEGSLMSYLSSIDDEAWVESSYDAEGPLYWLTMSFLVHTPTTWNRYKLTHLMRLIVLAHARHCHPSGPVKTVSNKSEEDYLVYKPYLVLFGLVDGVYKNFFKNVSGTDEQWPSNLADYIRHNDEHLLKASERLLGIYMDELLPCASFVEFCDVAGLLDDITQPEHFIHDLLKRM
ncbi:E3 ubiquitin-protein ligase UBR4 isoform X2 [Onthophagus taurus]|uniref:E3 ubiquitin-protein ligase UBR4 isoform X2 n=1 Tax=Onthophagus taurus TaxID=166361 RepID=UPI0039BE7C0D